MKSVRTYLMVTAALLILSVAAGIVVWWIYQDVGREQSVLMSDEQMERKSVPEAMSTPMEDEVQTPESVTSEAKPVTLTPDSLTNSQRAILESFGMGDTEVTITANMIMCASEALGKERYEKIINGAAPTPLEALALVPCVRR